MKKNLLILSLTLIASATYAQKQHVTDRMDRGKAVLMAPAPSPEEALSVAGKIIPGEKPSSAFVIGNTWYDTQTYNSGNMMNRIYAYPDGNLGATWMFKAASGLPDRGTAYNFNNGSTWSGAALHLGNDANNAFPSYAPWGPNGEIVAHYQYVAGDGPIKLLRRETKGTGSWIESVLPPPPGNYSLVWHSMITSGTEHQYIHVLAYVYDDPYLGQDDALLYYRSSDGGVTWEINGMLIDGLGSDFFTGIASLRYFWAQPVGKTLAFTYGFDYFDGLVFKSTDNGNTWQKTVVYQSPWNPFNIPDVTVPYGSGDGTSAIALDSQGKVHVVFGRDIWFHDVITTPPGGWYYYPTSTEGLIYWNESMPTLDSTTVSSYTLDYLVAGGNLIGWVVPDTATLNILSGQPSYGVGLTSQPQLSIDANDNLVVVYSALTPANPVDGIYFRRIYSNATADGGGAWNGIKELTSDFQFIYSECVYPAVAPVTDQTVHVVFQEDYAPGTGAGDENFMEYINFPMGFFVGTGEMQNRPGFEVSQSYPNPAHLTTRFVVALETAARVNIEIMNVTGQTLRLQEAGILKPGKNLVETDLSGLSAGAYFLVVKAGDFQVTRKVLVD